MNHQIEMTHNLRVAADWNVQGVNMPGIISKATRLVRSNAYIGANYSIEEVAHEIVAQILELYHDNPSKFDGQSPGYLLQAAVWAFQNQVRTAQRGTLHNLNLETTTHTAAQRQYKAYIQDEHAVDSFELAAAVKHAAMILGPQYVEAVRLLEIGTAKQDVAAALHVTGAAVSYYMRKLREQTQVLLNAV